MQRIVMLVFAVALAAGNPCLSQDANLPPRLSPPVASSTVIEAKDGFHRAVIAASQKMAAEGTITRRAALRLRVAMLSPAFRVHAEDLAVIQMAYSGADTEFLPLGEDGTVERASIDWDSLAEFLERLMPLILQLLQIFGGG